MDAAPIKSQIDTLIDNLCQLTSQAAISEMFTNYIAAIARFHHYSYYNTMAILISKPDATHVAGYQSWIRMHRYVKRGEKGIPILAPIILKPKDQEEDQARLVGFKVVYVFDISQTDGEPLPEAPDWRSDEMHETLHARLLDLAASKGITVQVEDNLHGAQGVSKGGTIILDPSAGTKTLVHEIAHELIHRKNPAQADRQRKEVEAESIAFVVCSFFGMSAQTSPNYLALWAAEPKTIKASLAVIQATSKTIIDYCHPNPQPEE